MIINKIKGDLNKLESLVDGRMSIPNACLYLGMSAASLSNLRKRGAGPSYVKFDRRVFYFQNDLDAWIKSKHKVHENS